MSKLLTDLMEAERRRRRLAIDCSAGDAATAVDARHVADQAAAAVLSRVAAEEKASELAAAAVVLSRATVADHEAAAGTASSQRGPERTGWRLFSATALALMAGIGTGIWLGKPPAALVRTWSEDPGALRLRLDDKLMNPPLQERPAIPRDRAR